MTRLRILSLALTTFVVAACGGDAPSPPASPGRDIVLTPDTALVRGEVAERATLDTMLRENGLAEQVVTAVVDAARTVFDPRQLRASQPFVLERSLEGGLRHFEYEIDADSLLRVTPVSPGADGVRAEVSSIPKTVERDVISATIDDSTPSLFQAMGATGESAELTLALAQVFAGEIDFNTEVQPGDRLALAFERFVREERPTTYGVITAAEFHNDGREIRAVRFTPPGGEPGYFDEFGRSLRRFFLRSPLKFDPRITSRYSSSRFHPVLQRPRAHRGVDYGAPTGAPVIAVATGTVVSATSDSVNGRMVRIRHGSGYDSYYLHLSAFARGVRRGARVDQGQTIGLVGSTGLATGPHLHYGLQKNGAWVDPLREHRNMPPGHPVPAAAMEAFRVVSEPALAALESAMGSSPSPEARVQTAE
jgi:murein DD-endopeptidase MepM/ murein hydrolase activator NlpD